MTVATATRAEQVADRLADREIDFLLVNDLVNVRWLTGFTGSNGLALVGRDLKLFVTDFRYVEQARAQVPDSFEHARGKQELSEEAIKRAVEGERQKPADHEERTTHANTQHASSGGPGCRGAGRGACSGELCRR